MVTSRVAAFRYSACMRVCNRQFDKCIAGCTESMAMTTKLHLCKILYMFYYLNFTREVALFQFQLGAFMVLLTGASMVAPPVASDSVSMECIRECKTVFNQCLKICIGSDGLTITYHYCKVMYSACIRTC